MSDRYGSRILEHFLALSDDGKAVWLVARQQFQVIETVGWPARTVDTLKELKTEDGRRVHWVDYNEFVLPDAFGEIRLRRAGSAQPAHRAVTSAAARESSPARSS
jgi:hypothetical protein